ncbi:MAG: hypothetical protein HHJ12_17930 [Glaciimonas sp.]|nr:hypothetical protein [Glaciimonas sp.]
MKNLIKRNLNGKTILLLFILTNIVYTIMLTITIPKVMQFSGGMKILDMMPTGYSAEYVNTFLSTLGEQGRDAYLFKQLPIDMIYPFLFGISYCLVLAYFLNKLGKLESQLFYFCLIPLFSGLFDYCENIGIITMINSYPNNSILLTQITSLFTILKSAATTLYFLSLIIFLMMVGKQRLFQTSKLKNEGR